MIHNQKICVVLPAYNAEKTLERTFAAIPKDFVDDIILVDDASNDHTVNKAKELGIRCIVHPKNRGYGGNQKTCYQEALKSGADIVVMLHPDYQYAPEMIPALASAIAGGLYDVSLGSRILGTGALQGGMPLYKYVANRFLTFFENILLSQKLSEYHTGYRAFSRKVLTTIPLEENNDDFIFDNQFLAQAIFFGFNICEITCPTRYFGDASSISFVPAARYGFGVIYTSMLFRLAKWNLYTAKIFRASGRGLDI